MSPIKTLKQSMKKAADAIRSADTIAIVSHVNPDGDTIGCLLGLGLGLLAIGKRAIMISPDGVPPRFHFLPGADLVTQRYKGGKVDVAIAVDCGSLKQVGSAMPVFHSAKTTIQIDHHDFGEGFCKNLVIDYDAAAVGEIIHDLMQVLKIDMTPAIATCLLTSIIVDTGSFRFSNVTSRTLRISANLLEQGVEMKYLIEKAYWKKTLATVKLEAVAIEKMKFELGGRLVWTLVRQKDFKKMNGFLADVDGAADALRTIDGVRVAAVMRETSDGRLRVSLRSGLGINVAKVAQAFGGGGHHNAAGCHMKATKADCSKLLTLLKELAS